MTLNPKSGIFFKWEAMFCLYDGPHPLTRHAARVVRQWPLGTLERERDSQTWVPKLWLLSVCKPMQ